MRFDRVIWDFNGTILDDVDTGIESADELLSRHGLPQMRTREKYLSLFGFPIIDYYRRLGFDFEKIPFSVLANEWVEIYLEKVKNAPVREGIRDVISAFRSAGLKQTVLSMTESSMLDYQLGLLGVKELFDEVYGLDDIYAKSKLSLAVKWKEEHSEECAVFVGDTTHDAESADIIGAECILLSGGHEVREKLCGTGAFVADSPDGVLKYVLGI